MDGVTLRELLPVLSALAGVIVGGLIAELRAALENFRGRRRALRVLLFHLLGLRHELSKRDPQHLVAAVVPFLQKHFGAALPDNLQQYPLYQQVLVAARHLSESSSVAATYREAVADVAPFDPILAYHLSGDDRLVDMDSGIREYFDELLTIPVVASDPSTPLIEPPVRAAGLSMVYNKGLDALSESALTVAGKLSRRMHFRVKAVLSRQDRIPTPAELNSIVEKFMADIPALSTAGANVQPNKVVQQTP